MGNIKTRFRDAFPDGKKLCFGSDRNLSVVYDALVNRLVFFDEENNLPILELSADGSQGVWVKGCINRL